MIDTIIYDYIDTNFGLTYNWYYGSAEGGGAQYARMFKIFDEERPETLCDFQGDTGRATFQFDFYYGGNLTTGGVNAHDTLVMGEAFKNQFKLVRGVIGSPPNDYRIENNITQGVRLLGEGGQTQVTWGAFFEAEIWWTKL